VAGLAGVEQLAAVAVQAAGETRLEYARTLVELGAALRRAGHCVDAREPLGAGLDIGGECGAVPLADYARQELVLSGARRTSTQVRGASALSPRERRVARLAADGMTNRQIAQALYVSLKTVEMHLSRAYRKLDISSRAALVGALRPAD
jgi:DNA-binding CsgD family transcriptional regulator